MARSFCSTLFFLGTAFPPWKILWLYKTFHDLSQYNVQNARKTNMKSKGFKLCLKMFWSVCKSPILSVKLKYPGTFTTFQFASFHFIQFLWKHNSFMWTYAFRRKKSEETLHLQPWRISLHLHFYICKLPFIQQISLETKMSPLISQMLAY